MVTQMTCALFSPGSHMGSSVIGLNSSLVACEQAPSLEEQAQQIQYGNLARTTRARGGFPCSAVRAEFAVRLAPGYFLFVSEYSSYSSASQEATSSISK